METEKIVFILINLYVVLYEHRDIKLKHINVLS